MISCQKTHPLKNQMVPVEHQYHLSSTGQTTTFSESQFTLATTHLANRSRVRSHFLVPRIIDASYELGWVRVLQEGSVVGQQENAVSHKLCVDHQGEFDHLSAREAIVISNSPPQHLPVDVL